MSEAEAKSEIRVRFFQLNPAKIVVLKSILETYEIIGELRTLDSDAGLVVVLALESSEELLDKIISSEPALSDLREIPKQSIAQSDKYSNDWLLKEILEE